MYVAHSREDGVFQPLREHLEGTAKRAAGFADAFRAAQWGQTVGLFHDIGKTREAVQRRIRGEGCKTDHATAGARAIVERLGMPGAYCVAGHHGRLPDGGAKEDMCDEPTLYARLKRQDLSCDRGVLPELPPVSTLALPLRDPSPSAFRVAFFIRMLTSCLIDADRLDTENFTTFGKVDRGGYDALDVLHARFFAYLESFGATKSALNQKRTEIRHACVEAAQEEPGLFSLTVPTGGGKTLSSMAFALEHAKRHGLERVIYVIPYVSIIEQNADVFRKALGAHNVVEHHANFSFADEDGGEEAWQVRQRLSTENWDAPVIVTTTVQFFESLFAARTSQLRKLHNIARSVVLFDEAQMIPLPYLIPCVEAIAELARNYSTTAVLMSATQPALGPYLPEDMPLREMMKDPAELYTFFKRTMVMRDGEVELETLVERLQGHAQVLCIVNTRKLAQKLYKALEGEGTYHLSTLMYPEHRRAVLREIRERLDSDLACRVVSTSLIEAGVDVSFPALYREEAGLDSVIQAAGRCNRENKWDKEKSVVHVFRLSGAEASVPPAAVKQSMSVARHIFDHFEDAASLEAIDAYFKGLYGIKGDALDQKQIMTMTAERIRSLSIPFRAIEKEFRLIENNTSAVIVAITDEARALVKRLEAGEHSREIFRRLGAFSVNIYEDHARALYQAGAITRMGEEGWLLCEEGSVGAGAYYDPKMGLALDVQMGLGLML